MKTYIVLISVDFDNARKDCEYFQDQTFDDLIIARTTIEGRVGGHVSIYSLNDFMDEVNDQFLDDLSQYYISYIHIK